MVRCLNLDKPPDREERCRCIDPTRHTQTAAGARWRTDGFTVDFSARTSALILIRASAPV